MRKKVSCYFGVVLVVTAVFLIFGCKQEPEPVVQETEPIAGESESTVEEQESIVEEIVIPPGAIELTTEAPQDVVVQTAYATDYGIFISFTCKRAGKLHLEYFILSSDGEKVGYFYNKFSSIVPNKEYIVDNIETLRHEPKLPEENWSPIVFSWED